MPCFPLKKNINKFENGLLIKPGKDKIKATVKYKNFSLPLNNLLFKKICLIVLFFNSFSSIKTPH